MSKDFTSFDEELQNAIREHGRDRIDIFIDYRVDDKAIAYGMYSSRNNSFGVTNKYSTSIFNEIDVQAYADSLGVGFSVT